MTAKCPAATWDPLGTQDEPRLPAHDIVCVHTMAGNMAVVRTMFKRDGYYGVESHFGVGGNGHAYQWQDADYGADANLNGNWHVLSIETEDIGPDFDEWKDGRVPPWTPRQIDTLVEIIAWCCKTYDIPPKLIPDSEPGRRGIAHHRQGINGNFFLPRFKYKGRAPKGELWSESFGKICPDDPRITQLIEVVIPRVQRLLEGDPDFDFKVVITRDDERHVRRFERARKRLWYFTRRKALKGWRVSIRKVKGGRK